MEDTVLDWAALNGHLECVKKLIGVGYTQETTTISAAAAGGHIELIKFLRATGIKNSQCGYFHIFPHLLSKTFTTKIQNVALISSY
jgi:ankyrin repeat protein